MINSNSTSKIPPPPPPPRMSTGIKGGAKRNRAAAVPASEIETASVSSAPAAEHQPKKSKCTVPQSPVTAESAIEASPVSEQQSKESIQSAKNAERLSSSTSCKKDEGFKKNYTSTVQNSYSGKSNFENNKLDIPSTAVFALSLLEWKFGQSNPEINATTRRKNGSSGGGYGEETLEEEFRRECVKPQLESLIERAEPELKEALMFILSAAESDINSKDCCSEGGKFPIMQELKIHVLNTEIGFSLFEYSPLPGKYDPSTISRSYFASLKKIICFLLGHPLFLFQNQDAQNEYFQELMGTIYDALLKEIANVKERRRDEICQENEKMRMDIESLEGMISGIQTMKDKNVQAAKETSDQIKSAAEKIENAKTAQEKMEEAINSMSAFMDCESNKGMYENMKHVGRNDLQSFTEKQNLSITEMDMHKREIEEKISGFDLDIQTHEEKLSQLRINMNNTEAVSRLDSETEEGVIKSQIRNAIDSFVKTFDPILQCIISSQTAKKKLMETMKKMTESDEVVQDGIMAIKTSVELFLENKLSARRGTGSTTHAAHAAAAVTPTCGPLPPPIPADGWC